MRVLSVASECAPLIKTGGLADVVGALPGALARHGVQMRVLLPGYPGIAGRLAQAQRHVINLPGGRRARLITGEIDDLSLILLDAPEYFDRPGNPYVGPDGADWPDNHLRFGLFCEVAAALAVSGLAGWAPDLVHAHDWQAGLVPAYLAQQSSTGTGAVPPVLLTIHNIAFQGVFPASVLSDLNLPSALMTLDGLEYYGQLSFLKGGLAMANRLSTVSPSYAVELMEPAFGMGMEGLLSYRRADLVGILNGVDTDAWDPTRDPALAATYSANVPGGKARNRAAVAGHFGLDLADEAPLFIVISRLTAQKGLDLLLEALPTLVDGGAGLAVLGSGDPGFEEGFRQAALAQPDRIGTVIAYDEPLSHLMQAGGDAIIIPSRFEPCGLTQLYGLRYGTLPVVARTGGLADTVIDANAAAMAAGVATGFVHEPGSAQALSRALQRAISAYADPKTWTTMRANAMRQPVGWAQSAAAYAALYAEMTTQ